MFKDSQSYLQQACCVYSPVRDWSYSNRDVTVLYNPIMDKGLLSNLFGLGSGCGNKPPVDPCVCVHVREARGNLLVHSAQTPIPYIG